MFRILICAVAAAGLAACGTAGESRILLTRLDPLSVNKPDPFPYEQKIVVDEISGLESDVRMMGNTIVSRDEFAQALTTTLRTEGMLSGNPADAGYRLQAAMIKVDTPYKISLSHSGYATFRYRLIRATDEAVVFEEEIDTEATLTVDDDYNGEKRLVNAGRIAIQKNIRKAVELLIAQSGEAAAD